MRLRVVRQADWTATLRLLLFFVFLNGFAGYTKDYLWILTFMRVGVLAYHRVPYMVTLAWLIFTLLNTSIAYVLMAVASKRI